MVTITSLVPKNARKIPGIAAAIAPATTPAITAAGNTTIADASGIDNATQILATHPQSAWPESPILKNPAELATANPRPVKINGAAVTNTSPIFLALIPPDCISTNTVRNIVWYPVTGLYPKINMIKPPRRNPKITAMIGTDRFLIFSARLFNSLTYLS